MLETIRNAFKIKDIRGKIIFTFICILIVRLGSQLPIVGANLDAISNAFKGNTNEALGFFDAMTGGSFTSFSIFALNISPYITASIIMQLLTIAIPALEELQKDGESGRKKIASYSRYLTVILALIEGTAMTVGFRNQGALNLDGATAYIVVISSLVAGSTFLMWLGEKITDRGIGNGISIILTVNIISRVPQDMMNLWNQFIVNSNNVINQIIAIVVIVTVIVGMVVFIILLNGGERRIPVQYSKKVQGRKVVGGQSTHIPMKVNTAGVIPVIFASSLLSFPVLIAGFFGVQPGSGAGVGFGPKLLKLMNSGSWFNISSLAEFKYTVGVLFYIALLIFFAYFYTTITFNPMEVANNMKKNGGFIPGIRPGKTTVDFLARVTNNVVMIGALGLCVVAVVPYIFGGVFSAKVSFGGTSLIIIVGVVLETMKQIESQMLVRHYRGFLND